MPMATPGNGSTTSPASRVEKGRVGAAMLTQGQPGQQPLPGSVEWERGRECQLSRCWACNGLAVSPLATEAGELVGRESRRGSPARNREGGLRILPASEPLGSGYPEARCTPPGGPCSVCCQQWWHGQQKRSLSLVLPPSGRTIPSAGCGQTGTPIHRWDAKCCSHFRKQSGSSSKH